MKYNAKTVVDYLNSRNENCTFTGLTTIECKVDKSLEESIVMLYYNKYAKPFEKCSNWYIMIDTAILEGPSQAIKYVQKLKGLTPDGVLGPKTKQACRTFNVRNYGDLRLKRLKSRSTAKYHYKGWKNRVNRVVDTQLKMR